ncbi:thioredoxin family protein [Aquimarina sp. W85]|uniref:thioredoxin family protein n=1 Tax=Aquimarina rhodophyticola TaxID=3342246 RepID=UPI003670D99C
MKKILMVLLITMYGIATLSAQEWMTNFAEAQKIAHDENKKVLLLFAGSDWCAPCIKLERFILDTEDFKEFVHAQYILVKADFPRKKKNQLSTETAKQNKMLADTYNPQGHFPLLLMLTATGEKLGEVGYKKVAPSVYIDILRSWEAR